MKKKQHGNNNLNNVVQALGKFIEKSGGYYGRVKMWRGKLLL